MTLNVRTLVLTLTLCTAFAGAAMADTEPLKTKHPLLVPHEKFSQDCGQCHTPKDWVTMRTDFHFDHKKETGYALNGAHAYAKCTQCHSDRGSVKVFAIRGCAGCHPDPHKSAQGPDCTRCHNEVTWSPSNMIAEHARTAFPLTGMHLSIECQQCHTRASASNFKGASVLCYSCHQADYARAANHVSFNYPKTCRNCHSTSSFGGAQFNHAFLSNVADCYTCHQANYPQGPFHVSFSYPHTCGDCHGTNTFLGARFTHSFLGGSPVCYTCHMPDYQRGPCHVSNSYSTICTNCHTGTSTWLGATPQVCP